MLLHLLELHVLGLVALLRSGGTALRLLSRTLCACGALCGLLLAAGSRMSVASFAIATSVAWFLQLAMTLPCLVRERYRFFSFGDAMMIADF